MADEIVHDAPEAGAEVTDLRSTIVAAVEKQRNAEPELPLGDKPDAPAAEAKPSGDRPETEAERNERLRDDKGRFAKGEEKPEGAKDATAPAAAEAPDASPQDGTLRPPPGWSPAAKVAFDKADPSIRAAVAKREDEINKGFAKLSEYKPIDRFMEMARQSGTSLDRALENYVGIENELRRDFIGGIARICQNQGVHPTALANAILARNGAAPSEGQAGSAPANQNGHAVDPAVAQRISALETFIANQEQQGYQTEIQRFASDAKNTFFENVRADMGLLIQSGKADTLEDAYDMACWANKEIRELLIKQQAAPSAKPADDPVQRARAAAKATGGAPSAGFNPKSAPEGSSLRETIRAAVNAQRGSI